MNGFERMNSQAVIQQNQLHLHNQISEIGELFFFDFTMRQMRKDI